MLFSYLTGQDLRDYPNPPFDIVIDTMELDYLATPIMVHDDQGSNTIYLADVLKPFARIANHYIPEMVFYEAAFALYTGEKVEDIACLSDSRAPTHEAFRLDVRDAFLPLIHNGVVEVIGAAKNTPTAYANFMDMMWELSSAENLQPHEKRSAFQKIWQYNREMTYAYGLHLGDHAALDVVADLRSQKRNVFFFSEDRWALTEAVALGAKPLTLSTFLSALCDQKMFEQVNLPVNYQEIIDAIAFNKMLNGQGAAFLQKWSEFVGITAQKKFRNVMHDSMRRVLKPRRTNAGTMREPQPEAAIL